MSTFEEIYHEELVRMTKSMIEKIYDLEKENGRVRQELHEFKQTIEKRDQESSEWLDNFLLESENIETIYIRCGNDNKRQRIQ
jgi:uncharacterized membrane-anchored protein YhcB (DUF1043 family)